MHAFRSHFEPSSYLDPRFAAPEYYDSDFGSVDTATDVYGLGAVCYSLFTGRPPFDGSYEEVRRAVLEESPVPPSAVVDAVPEAIDEVIAKALAKRKLTRYESVAAVLADLKRVADRDG
jgi:serine/threonine protein kinase